MEWKGGGGEEAAALVTPAIEGTPAHFPQQSLPPWAASCAQRAPCGLCLSHRPCKGVSLMVLTASGGHSRCMSKHIIQKSTASESPTAASTVNLMQGLRTRLTESETGGGPSNQDFTSPLGELGAR